jgi:uncharacterized protein (DUF697 family)
MSTYRNALTEYNPQMEAFEFGGEFEGGVFSQEQEVELAAELLEVTNEQELENFLGDLIKSAGSALGKIVKSPIGQAVGGVLKGVAKTALPIAGGALGTFFGGPIGATIGSKLGSMAGNMLGLETEGLSAEDREFEASRQFVRFAGETVKNALAAAPNGNPATVAQDAAVEASRTHAPGLFDDQMQHHHPRHHGHWVRHHDKIILYGV